MLSVIIRLSAPRCWCDRPTFAPMSLAACAEWVLQPSGRDTLRPVVLKLREDQMKRRESIAATAVLLVSDPGNQMHRLALDDELPRAARHLGVALATVEATTAE